MIHFKRLDIDAKPQYDQHLTACGERGCEYSFVNLFLWGRQKAALQGDCLLLMSQFDRRSVYPFPIGRGDIKQALDAIIQDAAERGIPCCLTSMLKEDCDMLDQLYPGRFHFHIDRDCFDYVYAIDDLADLKGRKFQKKRNHLHRFQDSHPDVQILPLDSTTQPGAARMLEKWFASRSAADPHLDFHLESLALNRAFAFQEALGLEGLVLAENGETLAFTMGSFLNDTTFDIHFEKALDIVDGAYAAINQAFASHLRNKYPNIRWLNREDDLGLEGLRKAKLSYCPEHMVEKYWARLWEDEDEL